MKFQSTYQKIKEFFSIKKKIERRERAFQYRVNKRYGNLNKKDMINEIETLENQESNWKMLSPIWSVSTVVSICTLIYLVMKQLGALILPKTASVKTYFNTHQLLLSSLIFISVMFLVALSIVFMFMSRINRHKQRVMYLKWLKKQIKN